MAGQPPEPSFQPSGQDQGLTQGRPAWQQSSYPPSQPYPGQDQAYTSQNYQGYQASSYGAQQGQGAGQDQGQNQGQGQGQGQGAAPPQWQGMAGVTPGAARTAQPGEKGFLGSLFDFSFNSFVTPKIIKVLYVLFTIWTALVGLILLVIGFKTGGPVAGVFMLIVVEPVFLLLTLGIYRVVLEAFMVIFRIYEETKKISESNENKG